ncbi:MAG TPA: type I-B CRISPR-associated protein Cas7/Csh2 [Firmicutes bacterium]|nr:type I-B CRISPR-associated protein Cas7/Csh2 [Bacillota bacterium]
MSFTSRREILFLYTVRDANPNGDPLNQNHPRYDEDTEQALVSDVRIKRTIRDQWVREGKTVFVDGESKTLKTRFEELKKLTGREKGEEVLAQCIDTRLFGVTFALGNKEAFSWTGPVQFKWGRSLHAATFEFVQGTAAFAAKEDSEQRSFRNEYKVPFALLSVYGIANQYPAQTTGASDEDLADLAEALWAGTDNLITRSKMEHKARLYLEVQYKEGFNGKIGSLDEKVSLLSRDGQVLERDAQKALRSLDEVKLDVRPLVAALKKHQDVIQRVKVVYDPALQLDGEDELTSLGFLTLETR